jgi:hypothetical protein
MSDFINISIPLKEQAKFKRWVNKLSAENKIKCHNLIANETIRMTMNAKMFASAQGLSGISQSIIPIRNSDLSGSVRVDKYYAPYVEWGTGARFDRPREQEIRDYAALWWTHKIWKGMRARPYLFPAYRIAVKELTFKLNAMGFKKKR